MTWTADSFPRPGTAAWDAMNARRFELVRKDVAGLLCDEERAEYAELQTLVDAILDAAMPFVEWDEGEE